MYLVIQGSSKGRDQSRTHHAAGTLGVTVVRITCYHQSFVRKLVVESILHVKTALNIARTFHLGQDPFHRAGAPGAHHRHLQDDGVVHRNVVGRETGDARVGMAGEWS